LITDSGFLGNAIGNISMAPTDIAATIAAYLGVKPPSGSVGTVLTEVASK